MVAFGVGYKVALGTLNPDDGDEVRWSFGAPVTLKGLTVLPYGTAAGESKYVRIGIERSGVEAVIKKVRYRNWGDPHGVLISVPVTNPGDVVVVNTTAEDGTPAPPEALILVYDPDPPKETIETALPSQFEDEPPWIPFCIAGTATAAGGAESLDVDVPADEEWVVEQISSTNGARSVTHRYYYTSRAVLQYLSLPSVSLGSTMLTEEIVANSGGLLVSAGGSVRAEFGAATLAGDGLTNRVSGRYRWLGVT